ncbi:daptide biosynthesis RiPP recognition protein [Parafrankia discariae]|uniref:daptide biosynthesis RiPP recognition protein n=1 Tax=Parafrankia discariae TaxID=365528 RepID=UPI00036A5471|nr:daptide biosynthesis RiPP recognition protein [Parafrankia discariae]
MRRLVLLGLRKHRSGYVTEITGTRPSWPLRLAQAILVDRGFDIDTATVNCALPHLRALLTGPGGDPEGGPDTDDRVVWIDHCECGDAYCEQGWRAALSSAGDGVAGAAPADDAPVTLPDLLGRLSEAWRPEDLRRSPYLDGVTPAAEITNVGLSLVADDAGGVRVDRPDDLVAAELAWLRAQADRPVTPVPLHGLAGSADDVRRRLTSFAALVDATAGDAAPGDGDPVDDDPVDDALADGDLCWSVTLTADLVERIGVGELMELAAAAGVARITVAGVADTGQALTLLGLGTACAVELDVRALEPEDVQQIAGRIGRQRVSLRMGTTEDGVLPSETLGLPPGLVVDHVSGVEHLQEISGRLGRWATGSRIAALEGAPPRAAASTDRPDPATGPGSATGPGARTGPDEIVLAGAEHLAAVTDPDTGLADFHTLVFAPADPAVPPPARVTGSLVRYTGAVADAGDELVIGDDFFLQTCDYSSGGYLSLVGPTLLRVTSEMDYAVFLEDADAARTRGEFPEHLLHPLVQIADTCALGTVHPCAGRRGARLFVSADGTVRPAPGGAPLGLLTAGGPPFTRPPFTGQLEDGDDPCLAAVVPVELSRQARVERPWLSRFLWSLDALRRARLEGMKKPVVSGFGGRLVEALADGWPDGTAATAGAAGSSPGAGVEAPDAPLLVGDRSGALLVNARDMRVFRIGADAAALIEIMLVVGTGERAVELGRARTRASAATVADGFATLAATFARAGVRLLDTAGDTATGDTAGGPPTGEASHGPATGDALAAVAGGAR